ncbi:anti-sigma-I factor RsgI family protein [Crassaminicella profunda]|uniref:anti-sigma-I factor RsgI family protein n=1 Tax=Crassaminicella profunda TaxID=1286698 RepID=UPI001CA73A22|nr:hypothetical protein [Crassaminicella profunda]QZY54949.1 hypothetical protein K7H06_18320 [Crassaminicella profunda]
MLKGKVVSIEKNYILVLSKDMEYLKLIKKNNVIPGNEIFFFEEDIMKNKNTSKYFSLGLVAAMLLILINAFIYNQDAKDILFLSSDVVAVVSIDINPSVEIEINKDFKVVDLKTYNDEGNDLLSVDLIKGKYITLAMKDIIWNAKNKHYLNESSDSVLVAVAPAQKESKENVEELKNQIETTIQEEGQDLKYIYLDADEKVLNDARKLDVSIGKLSIYKSNKNTATLEKVKNSKVIDLVNTGLINQDDMKIIKSEKTNDDDTNTKVEKDATFVIHTGNEFINMNALKTLNIETNINFKTGEILVKNQATNEIFMLKVNQDLIVKENMYFVSMKSIFDQFGYRYDYVGSNIHIKKEDKEITLKYFGTGELIRKADATVPKDVVAMKNAQSSKQEKENNNQKIKYTEISDINNLKPVVLVNGNELINEEILSKLNLEYSIDYNIGKVTFRDKTLRKDYSLKIENTLFKINGNIYFMMKDVLDLFHYQYRYVDQGIFIDTGNFKITLQGIRIVNANIKEFKLQANPSIKSKSIKEVSGITDQQYIDKLKKEEILPIDSFKKEDRILMKNGSEYISISTLKEFYIEADPSIKDKEIVFSKGDKKFFLIKSDISTMVFDNIMYVSMKDVLDVFGIKYEVKQGYVTIENRVNIKLQNISK